jgi:hypothetical protein
VNDVTFSFEFENEELTREQIQALIWEEIREYHPEILDTFPTQPTQPVPARRKSKHASSSADKEVDAKDAKDAKNPQADSKDSKGSSERSDDGKVTSSDDNAQAKTTPSKKRLIMAEKDAD